MDSNWNRPIYIPNGPYKKIPMMNLRPIGPNKLKENRYIISEITDDQYDGGLNPDSNG